MRHEGGDALSGSDDRRFSTSYAKIYWPAVGLSQAATFRQHNPLHKISYHFIFGSLFAMLAIWTISFPICSMPAIFGNAVYDTFYIFLILRRQRGSNEVVS